MSLLLVGLSLALLLAGALAALLRGETDAARSTWPLPVGEVHPGIDPLSAFFLACRVAPS